VEHQHPVLLLTSQPRLFGVRGVHRVERHLVIAQETVQALELPLGTHRFREAEAGVSTGRAPAAGAFARAAIRTPGEDTSGALGFSEVASCCNQAGL
jgi:hypothetical protein